ncbi:hypothetical protein [Primorskyibacter sp. S87]|uniref:hypothetical protein n=1 Tax=Primorskyibacter sp. S87 TaxID=3415126 RepID=UPI003C7CFE2E
MHLTSAIREAKSLTKGTGRLRERLYRLSRDEEAGQPGAKGARHQLAANFDAHQRHVEKLIEDTRTYGEVLELAAHAARTRTEIDTDRTDVVGRVSLLVRMGHPSDRLDALDDRLSRMADRSFEVAGKAEDRIDDADLDLECTRALIELLDVLSDNGFRKDHGRVKAARNTYNSLRNVNQRMKK